MRNIKRFEDIKNLDYLSFNDGRIQIHKILNGPNKDKVIIKEIIDDFIAKYSIMLGCTILMDSEYEKNEKIRNITLGENLKKTVQTNTLENIILNFLIDIGYENVTRYIKVYSLKIEKYKYFLKNNIQKVYETAINLGDIFDGLRKVREEFFRMEMSDFKKYELKNDIKKYNL